MNYVAARAATDPSQRDRVAPCCGRDFQQIYGLRRSTRPRRSWRSPSIRGSARSIRCPAPCSRPASNHAVRAPLRHPRCRSQAGCVPALSAARRRGVAMHCTTGIRWWSYLARSAPFLGACRSTSPARPSSLHTKNRHPSRSARDRQYSRVRKALYRAGRRIADKLVSLSAAEAERVRRPNARRSAQPGLSHSG
jgi:hypothetical protein